MRPSPTWAQMIDVFGCRLSSAFICARYTGSASVLGERHVDVVVEDHDEPGLGRKVENAIERGIGQAGGLARRSSAETNSLWMVNSPMPVNTPGNVCSTRRM